MVVWPVFLKQRTAVDRTLGISSLKQMGLSLIEFDTEYGSFPDATTIDDVKAATKTSLELGDRTSNDLFRQLVATGNKTERIFWAPQPGKRRKPNDILGSDALAKGECIYSYVAGLAASSRHAAPVAMAPMIPGTTQFDPAPYGDKAVVLRIDGSVRQETISQDTHEVKLTGGRTLLDPKEHYWRGKAPDLKWPE